MSFDIFCFEDLFDECSSSDSALAFPAADVNDLGFYSDSLCPLPDSPTQIVQQIFDEAHNHINPIIDATNHNNNNLDERKGSSHFDQIGPEALSISSSPPSNKMHNLSISQIPKEEEEEDKQLPHFQVLSNCWSSSSSSSLNGLNYVLGYSSSYGDHKSNNNGGYGNSSSTQAHAIQRNFSTKSLDGRISHEHLYGENIERKQLSYSPDNSFLYNHVRRVCSTGDLTNLVASDYKSSSRNSSCSGSTMGNNNGFYSSAEAPLMKMGKYTADERRERIDRYRAKRSLRNFNKTIKYVCRKTLADNRPRVRGRFARNEDAADNPNKAIYDDGIWVDGLHARSYDGEVILTGGAQFLNGFGYNHFEYHGYS